MRERGSSAASSGRNSQAARFPEAGSRAPRERLEQRHGARGAGWRRRSGIASCGSATSSAAARRARASNRRCAAPALAKARCARLSAAWREQRGQRAAAAARAAADAAAAWAEQAVEKAGEVSVAGWEQKAARRRAGAPGGSAGGSSSSTWRRAAARCASTAPAGVDDQPMSRQPTPQCPSRRASPRRLMLRHPLQHHRWAQRVGARQTAVTLPCIPRGRAPSREAGG